MAPGKKLKGAANTSKTSKPRNRSTQTDPPADATSSQHAAPRDPSNARDSRRQNRQGAAAEAEVSFLRDRVVYLNGKLAEYKDLVAKLTHEILAEDGVYRKKYNAKRRQLQRVKKRLEEKHIYIEEVGTEEEEDNKEVASDLMVLANEATEFLAREIEEEAAEGIDVEAVVEEQAAAWIAMEADVAAQARQAATEAAAAAAKAVAAAGAALDPPVPPPAAAAHDSPTIYDVLRGNPFSPLAELETDDIEAPKPHQSQLSPSHPLEPDDLEVLDVVIPGSRRALAF